MEYDLFYQQSGFYFGMIPSPALTMYLEKYNVAPCMAVDIGAGEGRNSFFLIEKGFQLVAIEPNGLGVNKMLEYAKQNQLPLDVIESDIFNGVKGIRDAGLIIASTVLDQLTVAEVSIAAEEIYNRLMPGGYVFASTFTENDPGYKKTNTNEISECGTTVKHYFKKNELKEVFGKFDILEYKEEYFEDRTHGKPHFHEIAILFARKSL